MRNTDCISFASSGSLAQHVANASIRARRLLKAMVVGAGLTFTAASSSLAQSYDPDIGSGNIVPSYQETGGSSVAQIAPGLNRGALKLYARPNLRASAPAWSARNDQGLRGADPDPNIQFQLNRESLQGRW